MKQQQKYTTPTTLKKNSWTDDLIERLLGSPDRTAINLHYKSGPRVRLYGVERVLVAETSDEFRHARESSKPRRLASAMAVETKRQRLMVAVEEIKIVVPSISQEQLTDNAIEHYNDRNARTEKYASRRDDPEFLNRITVNYLRHELTRYEVAVASVYGKVGVADARCAIREKVYTAISEAYPFLEDECERQMERRR